MYDYIIIGAGIVGLSTAWQLQQRRPGKRILLIDKEPECGRHQTGHNSGVIHAGIYYAPGSLKARLCKAGVQATIDFCQQHHIPFDQCGKLLVATNPVEQQRMQALYRRALENGLEVELLDQQQLQRLEPHISGCGAILVKTTGIVDYRQICRQMANSFTEAGGELRLCSEVVGIDESADQVRIELADGQALSGRFLVACAGLMADRIAQLQGLEIDFQIIPFRGEYYRLPQDKNRLVNHLIYPIPDPELPFLGVHLTRMIDGSITVGPNAVQGWKREGYGSFNLSLKDIRQMLGFSGFWRLLAQHWRTGLAEMKDSWWKRGYLQRVRKYCPELTEQDLQPYPAGIRAQAVLRDGTLVHDFLFAESPRSLHVCNAPSPAATSAIPIGGYICDKLP